MSGFWYLASPYSRYPGGLEAASLIACENAGLLVTAGISVFSPIAHTHRIAFASGLDPLDHLIWMPVDQPFMDAACGLIILMAEGWERSKGMAIEMSEFVRLGKPFVHMTPGIVPEALLAKAA